MTQHHFKLEPASSFVDLAAEPRPLRRSDLPNCVHLEPIEHDFLSLALEGRSERHIAWRLEISIDYVQQIQRSLEIKLGTDQLGEAAALLELRPEMEPSPVDTMMHDILPVLVGARIVGFAQEGDCCGLKLILASGRRINAWLCSDNTLEMAGFVQLATAEGIDMQAFDTLPALRKEIERALLGRVELRYETAVQHMRGLIESLADQAIQLLDHLDNDPDLEPGAELELVCDEDRDENPVSPYPLILDSTDLALQKASGTINPNLGKHNGVSFARQARKRKAEEEARDQGPRINTVKAVGGHKLDLSFVDGRTAVVDLHDTVHRHEWTASIRPDDVFMTVQVSPFGSGIFWPGQKHMHLDAHNLSSLANEQIRRAAG